MRDYYFDGQGNLMSINEDARKIAGQAKTCFTAGRKSKSLPLGALREYDHIYNPFGHYVWYRSPVSHSWTRCPIKKVPSELSMIILLEEAA